MSYDQYSTYAHTGGSESIKNRISPNTYDTIHSEDTGYPNKFDLFVNKENASLGGFSVTETHILVDLDGSKLYLDHRMYVDTTGGGAAIDASDGHFNTGSLDLTEGSISFSTIPTVSPFTVTYTARSDKTYDSHINVLQNAIMKMQETVGVLSPDGGITGDGAGISTMPLVTQFDPSNQNDLDTIKLNVAPNIVLLGHLESDLKIGSTNNTELDSYTTGVGWNITIGNPAAAGSRDSVIVDTPSLRVGNKGGTLESSVVLTTYSGDHLYVSGDSLFASQMTVGGPNAGTGLYAGSIPGHASAFYDKAMLRVNGGIYFGSGMSGVGSIVFTTTSGEVVDIVGTLEATDLHVENTSIFDGVSTFNSTVDILGPGNLRTNRDIQLTAKSNGEPALVDALDPSYARAVTESRTQVEGTVGSLVLGTTFADDNSAPYSSGNKPHPLHGTIMYPMLGGYSYTGVVNFAKAASHSHKNVIICEVNLPRIMDGVASDVANQAYEYGSYAPGLFNPGDTFVQINNGGSEQLTYPVYYHSNIFTGSHPPAPNVTGVSLYLAADDDVLVSPTVNGQVLKVFQPSNVPAKHIQSSFASSDSPTATFGNPNGGYYSAGAVHRVDFSTYPAWMGPSVGPDPYPIYKEMDAGTTLTTNITTALERSIDLERITAIQTGSYVNIGHQTGVAYLYATSANDKGTQHSQVVLRASPSPFGIAAANVWQNGLTKINPGQWAPVGEVTAWTKDSTNWNEVETISYRPNAFYDSCWVPLVNFRGAETTDTDHNSVPANMGRCLPILGTTDPNPNNAAAGEVFDAHSGDIHFFVEHNIGPVNNLSEVNIKVFVARYCTDYTEEVVARWDSIFRSTAFGSANLWTPEPTLTIYSAQHDNVSSFPTSQANGNGELRDITAYCNIGYFDSRFARVTIFDATDHDGTQLGLRNLSLTLGDYIRVSISRIR